MNTGHDEFREPTPFDPNAPTLEQVLAFLEKEFPTPPTEKHLPRSLPAWMRAEGACEIDARDEAWSRSGREIH